MKPSTWTSPVPLRSACFFSLSLCLVCSLLTFSVCLVLSPVTPFFVSVISSFVFSVSPFITSLPPVSIYFIWNLIFSLGLHLSLSGSLFYCSGLEAVVWDIPVSTVIDYGLGSFIGVLLSCKITQGSFFLSGNQFIGDIYSGMTFSEFVFERQTLFLLLAG